MDASIKYFSLRFEKDGPLSSTFDSETVKKFLDDSTFIGTSCLMIHNFAHAARDPERWAQVCDKDFPPNELDICCHETLVGLFLTYQLMVDRSHAALDWEGLMIAIESNSANIARLDFREEPGVITLSSLYARTAHLCLHRYFLRLFNRVLNKPFACQELLNDIATWEYEQLLGLRKSFAGMLTRKPYGLLRLICMSEREAAIVANRFGALEHWPIPHPALKHVSRGEETPSQRDLILMEKAREKFKELGEKAKSSTVAQKIGGNYQRALRAVRLVRQEFQN